MAKTRIFVLKLKKLLRVAIPAAIALVLFIFLLLLFSSPDKKEDGSGETVTPSAATYRAGVYTSVIELNDSLLNLEVVLDTDHINSVRLVNLDEATAAMYPLMEPAAADISAQLAAGTALDDITISQSSKYTQLLLIDGIRATLEKAAPAGKGK
ncbi:MAG: hypothetical protein J1E35_01785 [Lachnospiraceae bacterium]|nr:hypothetical protein [Lachnospiraceae bacterium]